MSKHSASHSGPRSSGARPSTPRDAPADTPSDSSTVPRSGSTPDVARGSAAAPRAKTLGLAVGITATLVAWGFLVLAAIEFGREARSGEPAAWWFLVLATAGAAACLCVTLILGAKVLDLFRPPSPSEGTAPPPAPRQPGGRRAAR